MTEFSVAGKMHVTLRQNFNQKYEDKNSPAFKILSGNFEKDVSYFETCDMKSLVEKLRASV